MAIAAHFDLDMVQLDGINVFCNSQMDKEIYVEIPEGIKDLDLLPTNIGRDHVLRLLRALYGLRRSPILWFNEFSNACKELGLRPIAEDTCLFTNGRILLFFYVDNIVLLSCKEDREERDLLISKLSSRYEMRYLGNLQWFLNIHVIRDCSARKIWLCQDSYIDKIVNMYNLSHGAKAFTPLSGTSLLPYTGTATPQQIYRF